MALGNDLNRVQSVLDQLTPIFSLADDIHKHTVNIGNQYRVVAEIDAKYALSNPRAFEAVYREISQFAVGNSRVQTVLQSIQASNIAPETGLNIKDQLVRTWDLAVKSKFSNSRELVIDNLNHNIEAGGGCLAGISARLAQPYIALAHAELNGKLPQQFNRYQENAEDMGDQDEEYLQALELSKQAQSWQGDEYDADLVLALEMSKTLSFRGEVQPQQNDYAQPIQQPNRNQNLNGQFTEEEALEHILQWSKFDL